MTSGKHHSVQLNATKLILACRSSTKGNAAKSAILNDKRNCVTKIEVWEVDLASFQSVLAFGERVRSSLSRLDAFIANAGLEKMEYTVAEGFETTLTVNVISTLLLNIAVLPKLRETSVRYSVSTVLTSVGSSVHIFGNTQNLLPRPEDRTDTFSVFSDAATADMGGKDAAMSPRYALSKTMLHALLRQLSIRAARPGQAESVIVNWVNPGWCASEISRDKAPSPLVQRMMFAAIGRTTEQGSRALVHGAAAGKETHGKYLSECRITPESDFLNSDDGIAVSGRLWRELMSRIERISPEVAEFVRES
jgi:NAD(P)-dependent dehydrogenase (short-subunit alcohol dehydrogenase family)